MGLSASLAAVVLAVGGHLALYFHLSRQNKKRDAMTESERQRQIDMGRTGDFHPDYRYAI